MATQTVTTTPPAAARAGGTGIARFFKGHSFISLVVFFTLMGVWELASRAGWIPSFLMPAPSEVAVTLVNDLTSKAVLYDLWITFAEVMIGFGLAAVTGIALGSLMALVPVMDKILNPYVTALQTIPKVAIAPLLIIWFGFGITSKVVIVATIAFFPVLVNTIAGLKGVDPRQLLLMRTLEASPWQVFTKIRIPAALPFLLAGFQIALVLSVIGAIVGEFLGAAEGLGSLIVRRQGTMEVAGVFSVLVILSAMGLALDYSLRLIARKVAFWSTPDGGQGGEH